MLGKRRDVLKYRKIALKCLFISITLSILATIASYVYLITLSKVFLYLSILLLIIFIVISFLFWRCPRCKKRLPIRFDIKNNVDEVSCPYCNMNFLHDDINN
ncbi:hypothetical protein [Clostridium lundense]|uniref:hypothetical protein n=1 Tax=Clostridium lundense TaxID=319475 RepID=UPI000488D1F1|nr:hypothetical protein [Clostridium lundense]